MSVPRQNPLAPLDRPRMEFVQCGQRSGTEDGNDIQDHPQPGHAPASRAEFASGPSPTQGKKTRKPILFARIPKSPFAFRRPLIFKKNRKKRKYHPTKEPCDEPNALRRRVVTNLI